MQRRCRWCQGQSCILCWGCGRVIRSREDTSWLSTFGSLCKPQVPRDFSSHSHRIHLYHTASPILATPRRVAILSFGSRGEALWIAGRLDEGAEQIACLHSYAMSVCHVSIGGVICMVGWSVDVQLLEQSAVVDAKACLSLKILVFNWQFKPKELCRLIISGSPQNGAFKVLEGEPWGERVSWSVKDAFYSIFKRENGKRKLNKENDIWLLKAVLSPPLITLRLFFVQYAIVILKFWFALSNTALRTAIWNRKSLKSLNEFEEFCHGFQGLSSIAKK